MPLNKETKPNDIIWDSNANILTEQFSSAANVWKFFVGGSTIFSTINWWRTPKNIFRLVTKKKFDQQISWRTKNSS